MSGTDTSAGSWEEGEIRKGSGSQDESGDSQSDSPFDNKQGETEIQTLKRQRTAGEEDSSSNSHHSHFDDFSRKTKSKSIKGEPDDSIATQWTEAVVAECIHKAVKEALEKENARREARTTICEANVDAAKKLVYTVTSRNKVLQDELAREKQKNFEWTTLMNTLQSSSSATHTENLELRDNLKQYEERESDPLFQRGALYPQPGEDTKNQEMTLRVDGLERSLQQSQQEKQQLQEELHRVQHQANASFRLEQKLQQFEQALQAREQKLQRAIQVIKDLQNQRTVLRDTIENNKQSYYKMESDVARIRNERNILRTALQKSINESAHRCRKDAAQEVFSMTFDEFDTAAKNIQFLEE